MNKKVLAVAAVVVVAVVAVAIYGSGEGLKGSVKKAQPSITVSVANTSPSGHKVVSPVDRVVDYKVCNNTKDGLEVAGAKFNVTYSWDLNNIESLIDPVHSLKVDDAEVPGATDHVYFNSAKFNYIFDVPMVIDKLACKKFSLFLNTQDMLTETVQDDLFKISMIDLFAVSADRPNELIDVTTNLPVSSNTLKY